jgi:small conductance mechanosensitive channel
MIDSFLDLVRYNMNDIVAAAVNLLSAAVILIIGWGASKWFGYKAENASRRSSKVDDTLVPIIGKAVRIFILIVTVLAVLSQFGIQTTGLLAVLGAAGLAVGLALQGTLSNIASGVLLMALRPFKVGDAVELDGLYGVIDEIGLFVTELHTFDNIAVTMPNSEAWGTIKNLSKNEQRRMDLVIGIGYDDDMDYAIELIREVLEKEERVLDEPEPMIVVGELGDSAVNLYVRPWTKVGDLWPARYDLLKRIKQKLDQEGINIPYPQRDVHLHGTADVE